MRRTLVRLFALVVLLGQMVQVGGGVACALTSRHHVTGHCDEAAMPMTGTSLSAPSHGGAAAFCSQMSQCVAPVPALTVAMATPSLVPAPAGAVAARSSERPPSFSLTPTPPPPES